MFDISPQDMLSPSVCSDNECNSTCQNVKNGKEKKRNVVKIKFSPEEDLLLSTIVMQIGVKDWIKVSKYMKTRNPRQCRERWNNYLNPMLRTDPFTPEEDRLLVMKYNEFGPHWNKISKFFINRSDNSLRNRWMMIDRRRSKNKKVSTPIPPKAVISKPVYVMPVTKKNYIPDIKEFNNPLDMLDISSMGVDDFEMNFTDCDLDFY